MSREIFQTFNLAPLQPLATHQLHYTTPTLTTAAPPLTTAPPPAALATAEATAQKMLEWAALGCPEIVWDRHVLVGRAPPGETTAVKLAAHQFPLTPPNIQQVHAYLQAHPAEPGRWKVRDMAATETRYLTLDQAVARD